MTTAPSMLMQVTTPRFQIPKDQKSWGSQPAAERSQEQQRQRVNCFREIRYTEESYVKDLTFMADVVCVKAKRCVHKQ